VSKNQARIFTTKRMLKQSNPQGLSNFCVFLNNFVKNVKIRICSCGSCQLMYTAHCRWGKRSIL